VELEREIKEKKVIVGVIGLGYVGLPLSIEIARAGFSVKGVDLDRDRVSMVNRGKSYITDVTDEELSRYVRSNKLTAFEDYSVLKECGVINICVPTPFTKTKDPDISYIIDSTKRLANYLTPQKLIILRSTTFPETTEKEVLPILERSGYKVGKDFFLSFAPERIDPGNKIYSFKNTPMVVGGITERCSELTKLFYKNVVKDVVVVSSPKVAEMAKLLENIFRSVNIALVNELALLCERMGIDIWEVIDAASTKPFGFMPFYPGPGIGGHCILVDPYYLAWKAKEYDFHSNFIELAAEVNENMPYRVVERLFDALSGKGICPSNATILILGVAFKRDVKDTRNSPALKVMKLLKNKVKRIYYNDPYVEEITIDGERYTSQEITPNLIKRIDCVLITTDHSIYRYDEILKAKLIFDTRNAIKERGLPNLVTLGYNNRTL